MLREIDLAWNLPAFLYLLYHFTKPRRCPICNRGLDEEIHHRFREILNRL